MEKAGLVTTGVLFSKKLVKYNTIKLYTRNQFHLREDVEGYSKLFTELFTNLPTTVVAGESSLIRSERLEAHSQRTIITIYSLVGTFKLDMYRVLEVVMTVFCEHVLHHHEYFVKVLSFGNPLPESRTSTLFPPSESVPLESFEPSFSHMNTIRGLGNLLGFMFSSYSEIGRPTPVNLFLVAAILTKVGLSQLSDYINLCTPIKKDVLSLDYKVYCSSLMDRYRTQEDANMLAVSIRGRTEWK